MKIEEIAAMINLRIHWCRNTPAKSRSSHCTSVGYAKKKESELKTSILPTMWEEKKVLKNIHTAHALCHCYRNGTCQIMPMAKLAL